MFHTLPFNLPFSTFIVQGKEEVNSRIYHCLLFLSPSIPYDSKGPLILLFSDIDGFYLWCGQNQAK